VLLIVSVLLLLAISLPAFAASHVVDEGGEGTETSTTLEPVLISEGDTPAVVIPEVEPAEFQQPWTARYLIPLLVVSAIAILAAVVVIYNRSVRNRYKVLA